MKKKFLLFSCLLLLFVRPRAQNTLPRAYEITTDTATDIPLDDYYQILEDVGGKSTINEVTKSPLADKFRSNSIKIKENHNTYWYRYRFKNNMTHDVRIALQRNATSADLYSLGADGIWHPKFTGTAVPWNKMDGLKQIRTITYVIEPGKELVIYERDHYDALSDLGNFSRINFGFTDKVIQEHFAKPESTFLPSFLFGLFVLAALFNIYFFLIVHERVYLFFSLTLLCRGLSRFMVDNNIFLSEHPLGKAYVLQLLGLGYFFFLIHFVRYFLETFKFIPRWDKFLWGLSIYEVILFILGTMNVVIGEPSAGIVMFLLLVTFMLRSNYEIARWRIVMVLPGICIFLIPLVAFSFSLLEKSKGVKVPKLVGWLDQNFDTLEEVGLMWLLILFSWSLFQRYQDLQKTVTEQALAKEKLAREKEIERNQLIAQQKVDLEKQVIERTAELKQSLENLKSTQAQLIQSEKMASLGELTAGIAHEIQNPLNFVNNFSEVNNELIEELKSQKSRVKSQNEDEDSLLYDIYQNNEKIILHGRRADAIVKGMLQHSRTSSGQKEPTDINALTDEYLRLAFHGLRAKDKPFNAKFETDFDSSVGKVNVAPQDMGRVILNLINNAFYAVSEKAKLSANSYEPLVIVSTRKLDGKVEVKVKDNGGGIPTGVVDKVFQPFFTTKPTGQGTGLGLSLAYDIVKAHGGDIKVRTDESMGSEFIVMLPV